MRKGVFSLCWGFLLAQNVGIGLNAPTARLHIRGGTSDATAHALRIDRSTGSVVLSVRNDGNVGIGTLSPVQRTEVVGNVYLSGDLRPAGNPGTSGQVLYSGGPNQPPMWASLPMRLAYVDIWSPSSMGQQGWSGANVINCGGQWMLGGPGQCGTGCVLSKTYTGLPPHNEVMVEVFYWAIDSWDQHSPWGTECVRLELDGTVVARGTSTQSQVTNYDPNIVGTDASFCGNTIWVDQGPIRVAARISHTAGNLQVRIIANLSQWHDDESLGVTAVRVWLR